MKVGYLGPSGTYSNEVALQYFNNNNNNKNNENNDNNETFNLIPYGTINETIEAAEKREVDISVVPFENVIEGPVLTTLDYLSNNYKNNNTKNNNISSNNNNTSNKIRIVGESYLTIGHCLLINKGVGGVGEITHVYSHVQALGQCKGWLASNLPNASVNEVSSTAKAAQIASTNPNFAAVGSKMAAQQYGMDVLREGIQDNAFNQTRFVFLTTIIENIPNFARFFTNTRNVKRTSIYLSSVEGNSILKDVLNVLMQNHNLLNIHSRPIKGTTWERSYFIDVEGEVRETLLSQFTGTFILGCYFSNSNQR